MKRMPENDPNDTVCSQIFETTNIQCVSGDEKPEFDLGTLSLILTKFRLVFGTALCPLFGQLMVSLFWQFSSCLALQQSNSKHNRPIIVITLRSVPKQNSVATTKQLNS